MTGREASVPVPWPSRPAFRCSAVSQGWFRGVAAGRAGTLDARAGNIGPPGVALSAYPEAPRVPQRGVPPVPGPVGQHSQPLVPVSLRAGPLECRLAPCGAGTREAPCAACRHAAALAVTRSARPGGSFPPGRGCPASGCLVSDGAPRFTSAASRTAPAGSGQWGAWPPWQAHGSGRTVLPAPAHGRRGGGGAGPAGRRARPGGQRAVPGRPRAGTTGAAPGSALPGAAGSGRREPGCSRAFITMSSYIEIFCNHFSARWVSGILVRVETSAVASVICPVAHPRGVPG